MNVCEFGLSSSRCAPQERIPLKSPTIMNLCPVSGLDRRPVTTPCVGLVRVPVRRGDYFSLTFRLGRQSTADAAPVACWMF